MLHRLCPPYLPVSELGKPFLLDGKLVVQLVPSVSKDAHRCLRLSKLLVDGDEGFDAHVRVRLELEFLMMPQTRGSSRREGKGREGTEFKVIFGMSTREV